jgi:hypothetical protein
LTNNRTKILAALPSIFEEIAEVNKKWHVNLDGSPKERNEEFNDRCILLMKSEHMEAFEGLRKPAKMDDKLPAFRLEAVEMIDLIIRGLDYIIFSEDRDFLSVLLEQELVIEDETWDITPIQFYKLIDQSLNAAYEDNIHVVFVISDVISYADHLGIDILEIYRAKTDYNKIRQDHSVEARSSQEGKQF